MGDPAMHRDCPLDCKVYVGNLGNNGNKTELERSFGYYGPLRSVWVARNPPGFAFVEFEDPRDATDAVRELDGRTLSGSRVRVELSNGEKRTRNRGPPPSWSRRPRDDHRGRRGSPPARRRSPRRRSFSRSRSRSLSRDRKRERSLSRDRNHKPSSSFSRSRSRSRSTERK
ncbi:serine/arginine-rich splicing factor 3-like [Oncorhynchus keta]|uniref:serine/arginine-rich splicing factor 3-like n=1 Tax=Oncorhynchus keta TaxID=8018 RepID=UPI0015FCC054|nr:serine/arginine-rich splicing factor 3-like [Oncorhynchus keta]